MQPSRIHVAPCKWPGCSNEESSMQIATEEQGIWLNFSRYHNRYQKLLSQGFWISVDSVANTSCGVVCSIVDASFTSGGQSWATEKKLDHCLHCLYYPNHFICNVYSHLQNQIPELPVEPNFCACLPANKFDFLFSFHTWQFILHVLIPCPMQRPASGINTCK